MTEKITIADDVLEAITELSSTIKVDRDEVVRIAIATLMRIQKERKERSTILVQKSKGKIREMEFRY